MMTAILIMTTDINMFFSCARGDWAEQPHGHGCAYSGTFSQHPPSILYPHPSYAIFLGFRFFCQVTNS